MGLGATDVEGRLAASVGKLEAVVPNFTPALDVPNGGLLCALPALLAVGLLAGVERHLKLPKGYYGFDSLLLLLAFMALARLESIESLRYSAPGEWGKLLGLDRVPEVRTLRAKIALLWPKRMPRGNGVRRCASAGWGRPPNRRTLHRRACARVQRQPNPAAAPLCGPPASVPTRHHRLLSQCHGRPTLLRGQPGGRPGVDPGHRAGDRAAPGATPAHVSKPLENELETLKAKRKQTPQHVSIEELPQEGHFRQLSTQSKHLVDTIKMIAYRAEMAMANSLREHLKRPDEARRLLRALYTSEADLLPDPEAGTLTVRVHHGANAATDRVIEKLCEELNATQTVFPRTNLRLVLKLGST
jgi:hypothetical protein